MHITIPALSKKGSGMLLLPLPCHLNSVYILSHSRIKLGMSCRCAIRFGIFIFVPGVNQGPNTDVFGEVVVSGIPSTFQRVDK